MDVATAVRAIMLFCIATEVITVNICKPKVIDKIYRINRHQDYNTTLDTNSALGLLTFCSVTKGALIPGVKCVEGSVDPPHNNSAEAHVKFYFKKPSRVPVVKNYTQCAQEKGYVKEYDASKNLYNLYFINIYGIVCYYRCIEGEVKDGKDFAAILKPVSTQDQPEVLEAVAECKKKLKAVGITEPIDVDPCKY
uniref:Lipocalin/cytosolic fatty-acid binding domain-containing protein n=1 Tax=Graphocephala atropunctata TaxID=36148 RepID=A0A1B6KQL7_9HEMI